MPKKKTGARKKAEKQAKRQKDIREKSSSRPVTDAPCNFTMECDSCRRLQKSRAFCYFCKIIQKLPVCAQCGKQKCMSKTGDCLVRHVGTHPTGLGMVGAICDFCEAWVCHSKKCLTTHSCTCVLADAVCLECNRGVWDQGGRFFVCAYCDNFLCEDDQFEHQAKCQVLESDSNKCGSCNKLGQYSCLRCKICFCDDHVKRKGVKYARGDAYPCPKCGYKTSETSDVAMSTRQHDFGRQAQKAYDDDYDDVFGYDCRSATANFSGFGGVSLDANCERRESTDESDEDSDDDDEDDDDSDDDSDQSSDEDTADGYGKGGIDGLINEDLSKKLEEEATIKNGDK